MKNWEQELEKRFKWSKDKEEIKTFVQEVRDQLIVDLIDYLKKK